MNITKFIKYVILDTMTIFLPIIIACNLEVKYASVLAIAVAVRAMIGAISNTPSNPPNTPTYEGITFKEQI